MNPDPEVNEKYYASTMTRLNKILREPGKFVVVFMSPFCGHCVHAYPKVVEIQKAGYAVVAYVIERGNPDSIPPGMTSVPTVRYYENGTVVREGGFDPSEIRSFLKGQIVNENLRGTGEISFTPSRSSYARKD